MYVAAGLHTITNYLIEDKQEKAPELLNQICPNGLISYGIGLESNRSKSNRQFSKKYNETIKKTFDKAIIPVKHKTNWILDSGGYQVSIGLLPQKDIPKFIESYKQFLTKYTNYYDEAFTLDLPSVKGTLTSTNAIYKANKDSLSSIIELPQEILDKLLFVSQFRTLVNFDAWNKLIYEDEFIKYFKRFSIGGLVVGQKDINRLPINLYTIGFMQILLYFKSKGYYPKPFRFHILGASSYKSVVFFYLMQEAVKHFFNIDMDITYDSSTLFKKMMRGRFFTYFDENTLSAYEISAKFKDLDKQIKIGNTITTPLEIIRNEITNMASLINEDITIESKYDIYPNDKDSFTKKVRTYMILIEAYEQTKFDRIIKHKVKEVFDLYRNGHMQEFKEELLHLLTKINRKDYPTKTVYDTHKTYINSIEKLKEFETIHDLEKFMYSYCAITDSEDLQTKPTWEL